MFLNQHNRNKYLNLHQNKRWHYASCQLQLESPQHRPPKACLLWVRIQLQMSLSDATGQLPRTKSTTKPLYDNQPLESAHERLARAAAVEANHTAVEKYNFFHARLRASRVVSLAIDFEWFDPASVVPGLSPRRLHGVPYARAASQALYCAA
jgi:hypothetical protein